MTNERARVYCRVSVFAILAFLSGSAGNRQVAGQTPEPARRMPVVVVSDGDLDPCDSLGAVTHLDPKGDNFLSVQSGPGGKPYTEKDRLHTGAHVHICGEQGNWWAVVYGANDDADCKLAKPRAKHYEYTGPCRYGWVAKRYVEIIAG